MRTLLCLLALGLAVSIARADTFTWNTDANGNWDNAANWTKTAGASARTYPDDSSDVAVLDYDITGDRTVTLPGGGITLDDLQVGDADASSRFIFDGTGSFSLGGGLAPLLMLNGATAQFDTGAAFGTNPRIDGSGRIVLNDDFSSSSFFRFLGGSVTLEVNSGQFTGSFSSFEPAQNDIEIGTSSLTSSSVELNLNGTTVRSIGGDRVIDDNILFSGNNQVDYTVFDGTNGNDLEITGSTRFYGRRGTDKVQRIDTSTLTVSGDVTWSMTTDIGGEPDGIQFVNGGTLEVAGSGNTYTDQTGDGVYLTGSGTFLVNNTTGNATGTGTLKMDSGVTFASTTPGTVTFDTVISGDGQVSMDGSGTLVLSAANLYTGGTEINSGAIRADHNSALGSGAIGSSGAGTLTADANRFLANALDLSGGGTLTLDTDYLMSLNGNTSGGGNLAKAGTGTVNLNGSDVGHTGTTTVEEGTLNINNATSSGTGAWTVQDGGTLGGGSLIGLAASQTVTIEDGGSVSPGVQNGDSIGELTVTGGALVFDAGATTYVWSFGESTNDTLAVEDLTFDAAAQVTLDIRNLGTTLAPSDSRVLFTYTGTLSNFSPSSWSFETANNQSSVNVVANNAEVFESGGAVYVTGILALNVPEPGTFMMVLVGGIVAAMRRRVGGRGGRRAA